MAQSPSISSSSINGGGGTSSNGAVALTATIGQPFAGVANAGSSTINSGFWNSLVPDPLINAQELIVNGSFENVAHTFVPEPNETLLLSNGATVIPGWTVVNASLLWGGNNDNGAVLPSGAGTPFGHFYVDLTGSLDTLPYAGVTQTIPTTPDQTYNLSFALGTVQNDSRWIGPISVVVMAGTTSNVFTSTPTGTDWQWRTITTNFTATSTVTPVTFIGNSAAGYLIALDNVSVSGPPGLRIGAVAVSGNDLRLSFPASFGHSYVIESSEDVSVAIWSEVPGTAGTGNGGTMQVSIPNAFGSPRQFYRVKLLP